MNCIGFGFSIWLLVTGIGLLKLLGWARFGSIIYACVGIFLTVLETIINTIAMKSDWIIIPDTKRPEFNVSIFVSLVGGLVYPILLLIFMQIAKSKKPFNK